MPSREEIQEKLKRASVGMTFNPRKGEYVKAEFEYGNADLTKEECADKAIEALVYALKKLFATYDGIDQILGEVK